MDSVFMVGDVSSLDYLLLPPPTRRLFFFLFCFCSHTLSAALLSEDQHRDIKINYVWQQKLFFIASKRARYVSLIPVKNSKTKVTTETQSDGEDKENSKMALLEKFFASSEEMPRCCVYKPKDLLANLSSR